MNDMTILKLSKDLEQVGALIDLTKHVQNDARRFCIDAKGRTQRYVGKKNAPSKGKKHFESALPNPAAAMMNSEEPVRGIPHSPPWDPQPSSPCQGTSTLIFARMLTRGNGDTWQW